MHKLGAAVVVLLSLLDRPAWGAEYRITVGSDKVTGYVTHFWRSTGFCPPDPHQNFSHFILSEDEHQNLLHIASVPNHGIHQVRIHWLLDLITATVDPSGAIKYNFTVLDDVIALLHSLDLKPGFELMGNPSNIFNDFENKTQVYAWRDLVYEVAVRYINKFGLDYVSQWNFETWNEPDTGDFDGLKFTPKSFLNYYDACSEGLAMVKDTHLMLGMPAEKCSVLDDFCMSLLLHCYNGTNYFTGETGVRVDYLSFHNKGDSSALSIVDQETEQFQLIQSLFSNFESLPFYNDEADPKSGWNTPEEWRADARYAAMVVKGVTLHQYLLLPTKEINYQLLSNDNGFMNFGPPSYFDQRTLTARFQMNLTNHLSSILICPPFVFSHIVRRPRSIEFVRKPVLSAMGLLSLLGAHQIEAVVSDMKVTGQVGVLATLLPATLSINHTEEAAFLVYNSLDSSSAVSNDTVDLKWSGLDLKSNARYVRYQIDNSVVRSPYAVWQQAGKPDYPSYSLLQQMRDAADSLLVESPGSFPASGTLSFSLPLPGVTLLHACQDPQAEPTQVTGVKLHSVIAGETMVTWNDNPERCILTYEVAVANHPDGPFKAVNSKHLLFPLFVCWEKDYIPGQPVYFSVHAVDYWGRAGAPSQPVCLVC